MVCTTQPFLHRCPRLPSHPLPLGAADAAGVHGVPGAPGDPLGQRRRHVRRRPPARHRPRGPPPFPRPGLPLGGRVGRGTDCRAEGGRSGAPGCSYDLGKNRITPPEPGGHLFRTRFSKRLASSFSFMCSPGGNKGNDVATNCCFTKILANLSLPVFLREQRISSPHIFHLCCQADSDPVCRLLKRLKTLPQRHHAPAGDRFFALPPCERFATEKFYDIQSRFLELIFSKAARIKRPGYCNSHCLNRRGLRRIRNESRD